MSQQGALTVSTSGGAVIETLTGNTGGPVGPDAGFNINVVGNNTSGINVVGMPGTSTLTIVGIQSTTTQQGSITLATNAEAIAGTDTAKAVTSDDLKAKLGTQTLHGLPIGAGTSSALTWTAAPTNGQLLIGSTGSDPVLGNLTSTGGTITITDGAGTINLEATGASSITLTGDNGGPVSGNSFTFNANSNSGSTAVFARSGTTFDLKVTDSISNTILGFGAGNLAVTGHNNTSLGAANIPSVTSGANNTAIGTASLNAITTGSDNTALGYLSLLLATGSNNIAIGSNAGLLNTGGSSSIHIGNNGANESNTIRIGTQGAGLGQQNLCFVAGITGVSVSNKNIVTIDTSTGQLGSMSSAGVGFTWNVIGANQTLAVANGYICTSGAGISLALPGTSAVGDMIEVVLDGSTSWTITQPNAATRIRIGNTQTTLGVGGSLASTAAGDSVRLICETANARWVVVSMIGNITVV